MPMPERMLPNTYFEKKSQQRYDALLKRIEQLEARLATLECREEDVDPDDPGGVDYTAWAQEIDD